MTHERSDDDLEQHLATMLHERAGQLSSRVAVDREVIGRARRRRTAKLASMGSGVALCTAVVVVAALAMTGSPRATKDLPPATQPQPTIRVGTTVPVLPSSSWAAFAPPRFAFAPRSSAASAIAEGAFVVWGGQGAGQSRLRDGAWYDIATQQWHRISASPLPAESYPAGAHFLAAQATGDSVVIVNDGHAARYWPRLDHWLMLADIPLTQLDSLAIVDDAAVPSVVLSGADHAGRAAYAAMQFPSGEGSSLSWSTGSLPGRSAGRPVLTPTGLHTLVHVDSALELSVIAALDRPDHQDFSDLKIPSTFKPKVWTGREMIGTTGTTGSRLIAFDPATRTLRTVEHAYDGCANAHIWTGKLEISWGATVCKTHSPFDVAFDPVANSVTAVARAPIVGRLGSAFAVSADGRLFVWGGEDAHRKLLTDGAILTTH